jgi:hypothetical protein
MVCGLINHSAPWGPCRLAEWLLSNQLQTSGLWSHNLLLGAFAAPQSGRYSIDYEPVVCGLTNLLLDVLIVPRSGCYSIDYEPVVCGLTNLLFGAVVVPQSGHRSIDYKPVVCGLINLLFGALVVPQSQSRHEPMVGGIPKISPSGRKS